ncbi:MAG TPA: alkaline phosphatase family protein [Bacteroidia bacterium]|nr:alkaline phosphatase family protein [Bacteroidia bacterium]
MKNSLLTFIRALLQKQNIFLFLFFIYSFHNSTCAVIPKPNKVVICVLENHGYPQIVGSGNAPYIDQLAAMGANMIEFYALTHPSQPNYIMLFSGENQGVTTDAVPNGTPWTAPNLGASLIAEGFTFGGYSEDLPGVGSNVASAGAYARKHNPWVNWQGTGTNQIPASCNMPMTMFPTDFNQLPDLSFVVPNQDNDMHNGSDPARIIVGDDWVRNHLEAYVNWAMTHNSLFILTFDEDNNLYQNRIPTIFVGPMVQPGNYLLNGYHHYDHLRTLEDMFGLPYAGASAAATPIEEIWLATGIHSLDADAIRSAVYPNPVKSESNLVLSSNSAQSFTDLELAVYDILGNIVRRQAIRNFSGSTSVPFRKEGLPTGMYYWRILNRERIVSAGKVLVE